MPLVVVRHPVFAASLFFVCWSIFNCPKTATQPDSPVLASLTFSAPSVAPGETVTATIRLTAPAGRGGVSVSITPVRPHATMPETVVVPEGADAATFLITISPSTPTTLLPVEARASGSAVTAHLPIVPLPDPPPATPPLRLASIALDTDDLIGGRDVYGTLTFSRDVRVEDPNRGVTIRVEECPETLAVMQAGTRSVRFKLRTSAVGQAQRRDVTALRVNDDSDAALTHIELLPLPALYSLAPVSISAGAATEVLLTGNALTQGGGTRVNVSGSGVTASVTTILDTQRIRALFTVAAGAAPGSRAVSVTNNSATTNAVTLTIVDPAPTIASISPASGSVGFNVEVTITGTNFTSGSTVAISGGDVTIAFVTVVNSTTITATFQIGQFAAGGARHVTVTTADGTSNAVTFTINP